MGYQNTGCCGDRCVHAFEGCSNRSESWKYESADNRRTRIYERPVIVSGCHDQIAAAIGSGVFNERHGVDGTGTVECITVAFSKGQKIDKMLLQKSGFAIVPYMKDLFVTYAFSYTGGALLKWYRDKVSPMEAKEAYENGQIHTRYITGEFLMENRQNY